MTIIGSAFILIQYKSQSLKHILGSASPASHIHQHARGWNNATCITRAHGTAWQLTPYSDSGFTPYACLKFMILHNIKKPFKNYLDLQPHKDNQPEAKGIHQHVAWEQRNQHVCLYQMHWVFCKRSMHGFFEAEIEKLSSLD